MLKGSNYNTKKFNPRGTFDVSNSHKGSICNGFPFIRINKIFLIVKKGSNYNQIHNLSSFRCDVCDNKKGSNHNRSNPTVRDFSYIYNNQKGSNCNRFKRVESLASVIIKGVYLQPTSNLT